MTLNHSWYQRENKWDPASTTQGQSGFWCVTGDMTNAFPNAFVNSLAVWHNNSRPWVFESPELFRLCIHTPIYIYICLYKSLFLSFAMKNRDSNQNGLTNTWNSIIENVWKYQHLTDKMIVANFVVPLHIHCRPTPVYTNYGGYSMHIILPVS